MKSLEVSLYNLSFLILTKKGACSQFIYSCVCRAPCCVFSVKNHGVSVNFLALSSAFRYICYIKYQFLSIQDYQKQDRWTTAQEFYLSLRFPSIPSSFFSHRLFPGRFISFIFFILPSDVPGIRLPSLPASSPPLQAPALPPG